MALAEKMKIGLSTSVIQRGQTGIGRYVLSLTRSILESTADIELVLFVLEDDFPLFSFAKGHASIVAVPERFRSPTNDILWHQMVLPGLARRHRLDVLHVPSYRRMLWSSPCPSVATIHDLAAFHVKGKYDWKRTFYGQTVARFLARRQSRIIAISQHTARDIQRFFGVSSDRITVIHNGIDHQRFHPPDDVNTVRRLVTERYGVTDSFFLYVARLEHPGKNHLRLVEAFNQFKAATRSPWKLVFAGSDWHGAEAIHATVENSPYRADIHRLGFVADFDLPALYGAAGAFVYPSLFEGFGLPPIEAMACGCPVVCSTRGALGEVVAQAAFTIDPENVAEIAAALARIAANPSERDRLRIAGLARAQQFTWSSCAELTIQSYAAISRRPLGAGALSPHPSRALPFPFSES